jgi:hypothetical protein
MPEKEVVEQAKEDLKEGKSPSTAAGEFVREEIEHVREGKHGAPRGDSLGSAESRRGQRIHARKCGEGYPQRTVRYQKEDVGETVARKRTGPEEGTAIDCFPQGAFRARQKGGEVTLVTRRQPRSME